MKLITSKTHRYLSVRLQPSDYTIKKFHEKNKKALQKMWDYGKLSAQLNYDLYELITGKPNKGTYREYVFFRDECVKEEIYDVSGIQLCRAEHYLIICIPKNEMTDYYMENIPKITELETKELKKTRGSYGDYGKTTYWRDESKRAEREFLEKHPEYNGKIFGDSEK